MKLHSYVVARDFGFAPNPFYGVCTLATCKPKIREHASIGDWIIGTSSAKNCGGYLVFAMKIEETMDFDCYWNDPRFACKKPLLNGSLKQLYGDNIYHRLEENWMQEDSHHSLDDGTCNIRNIKNDTQANRVLISNKFVYFGRENKVNLIELAEIIGISESLCKSGMGHKSNFSQETINKFTQWLEENDTWGIQGEPREFSNHKQNTV